MKYEKKDLSRNSNTRSSLISLFVFFSSLNLKNHPILIKLTFQISENNDITLLPLFRIIVIQARKFKLIYGKSHYFPRKKSWHQRTATSSKKVGLLPLCVHYANLVFTPLRQQQQDAQRCGKDWDIIPLRMGRLNGAALHFVYLSAFVKCLIKHGCTAHQYRFRGAFVSST